MITKDSLLPEVIARHPGTREVFDRYGLQGCGGPLGPSETVEFFSRVHAVPLEKLLADLEAARDAPAVEAYSEDLGDVLYRRFFRAAIVVILTTGATLGAAMLLLYGRRRSFTSLDLFPYIQAHANAQIFGWVGLFVMGFALQGLPRFKYVRLWRPDLANVSFWLMIAGLAVRVVPGGAIAGALLEAAAIVLFAVVLGRTLRAGTTRDPWDKYVTAGLSCFVLSGLLEPILAAAISTAPTTDVLIARVATFMGPYRDLQILGFAGLTILGVSQRILPTAFGFREVRRGAFPLLASGLLLDMTAWLLFRATRQPGWAIASWAGTSLYALGALWMAWQLRGPTGGDDGRSTKFIRAAYLWLVVACLMMIAEPLYARAAGLRFSHAYHGAIRHAFTVGFISLMIVGVSSKVVPILQGIEVAGLPRLWLPFVLINAGNTMRVVAQVATDWVPGPAFPVMGASGTLEVAGLAVWGVHLWRLLRPRPAVPAAAPSGKPERLTADMRVAEIVEWYPGTLEVFERFGFKELRNPLLRNTIARRVTVRMACGLKHVDEAALLSSLQEAAH